MRRRRFPTFLLLALILVCGAGAAFLLTRSHLLNVLQPTQLAISNPEDGSLAPLHGTLPVIGEANSAIGVRTLELWVNSQKWAEANFEVPQKQVHQVWAWTPSGEGKHVLLLRAVDAYGRTLEASLVTVYASAHFDIRFPLAYTAKGGETLDGLAASYDTDPQAIAASNPGLDPAAPLPPGMQITIPVPIPNAEPVGPQGGQPPVPPAGPLPGSEPPEGAGGAAPAGQGVLNLSMTPAFEISSSAIVLKYPVQQIYAYISLAGGPWMRLPSGDFNFLNATGNTFDLRPYLTPQILTGLPSPAGFEAHVWGWAGGHLVYLGKQSGVLDEQLPQGRAFTSTKLAIIGRIRDSVSYESQWTIPSPIPGYYQGFKQGFRWTNAVPGVTGGLWQVSTQPFAGDEVWGFVELVDSGSLAGPKTVLSESLPFLGGPVESELQPVQFTLDFAKYLDLPQGSSFFSDLSGLLQKLTQASSGWKRVDSLSPNTFYIRVLPIMGSKLGPPSNTVIVHYGPPEPQPVTDATGPLYDVKVLSFTPYRAPDPAYKACMVTTMDYKTCHTEYLLNPLTLDQVNLHMQNVLKIAEQSGNLGSYKDQYPGVIIQTQKCETTLPKGTQSCGCPGVSCSSGSSCSWSPTDWGSCAQEGIEWGVAQLKAASNWVSKAYEDIKEFAVDVIMKYTPLGMACKYVEGQAQGASGGALPPDSCRKAFKAAIEYGLASMGLPPTLPNLDQAMSEGQEYLVQMAIDEMKSQGLECDDTCAGAIKAGYGEITNWATAKNSGPGGAQPQFYQPHPLALEQQAVMMVSVTRRPETAGIPDAQTAGCRLFVFNGATNSTYGPQLEGAPFNGVGLKIPPMQPGNSMTIPVALTRMPWDLPAGVSLPSGQAGVILGGVAEADYGQWSLLYNGSTITFDLRGPGFPTLGADGKNVYVNCMDKFKYQAQIPAP